MDKIGVTLLANKVCPVVLRRSGASTEVLAFKHPLAGLQLVKGTIEADEPIEVAALHELAEESGIVSAVAMRRLGTWSSGFESQVWEFAECEPVELLAESWVHQAPDDDGHAFEFFWHPLHGDASPTEWHAVFLRALAFIEKAGTPFHRDETF